MGLFKRIYKVLWETFHIFFRHYNFPCELGLHRVGSPGRDSPVFLSGNYTLVVERLLRVLRGIDCYLLVANSRGSNVWCAAGMNEFNEFDVIDAINVSGLTELVDHRKIIAPPYAAPGVNAGYVSKETGFRIHWGPTHLNDIPEYVKNSFRRSSEMCRVQFGFLDRMEQALATTQAYCLTIGVLAFFFPVYVLGIMGLIAITYLVGFALWDLLPKERFYLRTATLMTLLSAALLGTAYLLGWSRQDILIWEGILLAVVVTVAMDGCGSSTLYKTTIRHWVTSGDYKSLFSPVVDPEKCTGCNNCLKVCPKGVLARNGSKRVVSVQPDDCIECLACVKQCGSDAFFNRTGRYKGDVKSIDSLHHIMTRDWSHLRSEDRWKGARTLYKNGILVVDDTARSSAAPDGESKRDAKEFQNA